MYYYLDKEKHRDRFHSVRAKLYLTRVHQTKNWNFLLQFVIEHISVEQENSKKLKQKRRKNIFTDVNPKPKLSLLNDITIPRFTTVVMPESIEKNNNDSLYRDLNYNNIVPKQNLSQLFSPGLNNFSYNYSIEFNSIYTSNKEDIQEFKKEKKKRRLNDGSFYPLYKEQIKMNGNVIEDTETLHNWFSPPPNENNQVTSKDGNRKSDICNLLQNPT